MTETMMPQKSGKLKVTIELEVNDELMGVVKEAMSKAGSKIPEMMRGGSRKERIKPNTSRASLPFFSNHFS